ncbi:MAG: hypothetical protein ACI3XM_02895 [Eubacteriales bacterium]
MKRSCSLFLAALAVLTAALSSCGGDMPSVNGADTRNGETAQQTDQSTTEPEPPDYFDELVTQEFAGRTYRILDANDHPEMHVNMPGDAINGDIVNDALFNRDITIEDRFGIDIQYEQVTGASKGTSNLRNSVLANEDVYTLCISTVLGGTLATLATDGTLHNLTELPCLSLDQKWWSSLMYDSMRLDNRMYFTTGDISPTMYQMAGCLFLNQKLLTNYDISTDFIQLVRDGNWTLDCLIETTKDLYIDVNNNGKEDLEDDIYGFINNDAGSLTTGLMLESAGVSICKLSEDGSELILNLDDPHTLDVIEKYSLLMTTIQSSELNSIINRIFKEDRALALIHYTETASVHLRDMESDYLILPMPKYDASQESYRTPVNGWADAFIGIPLTADPSFAGCITEALAYYSYQNIRPLAFEMTYKEKAARNQESAEMLDLVFDNCYMNFNTVYDFGGINTKLTSVLEGKAEYASAVASLKTKAEAALEKLMENWCTD